VQDAVNLLWADTADGPMFSDLVASTGSITNRGTMGRRQAQFQKWGCCCYAFQREVCPVGCWQAAFSLWWSDIGPGVAWNRCLFLHALILPDSVCSPVVKLAICRTGAAITWVALEFHGWPLLWL